VVLSLATNELVVLRGVESLSFDSEQEGKVDSDQIAKNLYNFASVDCGGKVAGASPEAKYASSILTEDKDRYLLIPCDAKKWVVIELCEEVLADSIVLANFEHYASNFRDFQVLGSQQYPVDKWLLLGEFTANNTRTVQTFSLPRKAWVKNIKLRFLSYYGNEHFCPLSLVRVHGSNVIEDFKEGEHRYA